MEKENNNGFNSSNGQNSNGNKDRIGQEQFQTFVFNQDISWQEIIYDLINTEQLDPWDIDLAVLSQKYLEKIRVLEETNFIISSRVL